MMLEQYRASGNYQDEAAKDALARLGESYGNPQMKAAVQPKGIRKVRAPEGSMAYSGAQLRCMVAGSP
jgi:hypothetical protein